MSLSKPRPVSPLVNPFVLLQKSDTLDHLIRLLSTWSGTDKVFMLFQYSATIFVWALRKAKRGTGVAEGVSKMASTVSDARVLYRIWGLLPIVQWMASLEREKSRPPTKTLLFIERLQGWSMLAYYPLEHTYYLASKGAISISPSRLKKISVWSCRFWALYVILQLIHLNEDLHLLQIQKNRILSSSSSLSSSSTKGKGKEREISQENTEKVGDIDVIVTNDVEEKIIERKENMRIVRSKYQAILNEYIVNLGYLPLTVHWSLEKGIFSNPVWVGLFGTIAAIAQLRAGWKATAV